MGQARRLSYRGFTRSFDPKPGTDRRLVRWRFEPKLSPTRAPPETVRKTLCLSGYVVFPHATC